MTFPMNAANFAKLGADLSADGTTKVVQENPDSGQIETHDVILSYAYLNGVLAVDVMRRKSFEAHLASDSVIFSKIEGMLAKKNLLGESPLLKT